MTEEDYYLLYVERLSERIVDGGESERNAKDNMRKEMASVFKSHNVPFSIYGRWLEQFRVKAQGGYTVKELKF